MTTHAAHAGSSGASQGAGTAKALVGVAVCCQPAEKSGETAQA